MRALLVSLCLLTLTASAQVPGFTPSDLAGLYYGGGATTISGIVAWWKIDENTGTTISSSGSTSMPGYFAGSPNPVWTNGVVSKGLHFSGEPYIYDVASGLTQSTNLCAFVHTNATFTIALWARIHPGRLTTRYGLIGNSSSSGDNGFLLSYGGGASANNTNRVGLQVFRSSVGNYVIDTESPSYWTNSAWHHITFTCSGTSGQWYWDGTAVGSSVSVGTKGTGAMTTPIRMADYINRLQGTLDDVRIYNRALTSEEVGWLYNGGAGTGGNP